ncbi:phage tail tape measure protein, partial [Listeria monocytogenes]|nr:phage tail tape measure protein [Listeria monocytogenes]
MAKKRIQGITIALDADTKGVTSGLKDVVSQSNKVSGELRQVESLLKFNPDNVTLLAQKQELLTKQVDLTTKRLEAMKGAQEDVQNQFKNGDIGEEEFRTFQREIAATEGRLDNYKKKLAEIE